MTTLPPCVRWFLVALLCALAGGRAAGQAAAGDKGPTNVASIRAELETKLDDAPIELVTRLANHRTRPALEALLACYEKFATAYMRRAVLFALPLFDGVPDAEQPAAQKLLDVATQSTDRDLRLAAVDSLAECGHLGQNFLALIVDSPADDEVRELAMRCHTGRSAKSDQAWYRKLYQPDGPPGGKPEKKKEVKGEAPLKEPRRLERVRELAFDQLAPALTPDELVLALKDASNEIRVRAIEELDARGDKRIESLAEDLFKNFEQNPSVRAAAARILARERGARFSKDLIESAVRADASVEYQQTAAELVAKMRDAELDKQLLKLLSGKTIEQRFALRAGAGVQDPKFEKALLKLLDSKDSGLTLEAVHALGARQSSAAAEELDKLLEKSKDPLLLAAALEALSSIRAKDQAWATKLMAFAQRPEDDLRNAAVGCLGRLGESALPALELALAHPLWSTRLAALAGLESMRSPAAVGLIVKRLELETGRTQADFADALFRLSGQPFRLNAKQWQVWWEQEGANFKPIDASTLAQRQREEETRRLKESSSSNFFGIRIRSTRVLFIIDVSGSMLEPTAGEYVGEKGPPRIDVAKRELKRCLDGLGKETLFNIVTFSSDVTPWLDAIAPVTPTSLGQARGFVDKLQAAGGTNLFGALEKALQDPDVDTIFVLSDGEPSVGKIIDPLAIREAIGARLRNRKVVIHSIAIGGQFKILEWLAQDTGGTHLRFP